MKRFTITKIPYEDKKFLSGKPSDLNNAMENLIKAISKNVDGIDASLKSIYPLVCEDWITIADGDATPSVKNGRNFVTGNSAPTVITALDDGLSGQTIWILIGDNNTTFDFTGTDMDGNGGVDWSPASGDFLFGIMTPAGRWKMVCIDVTP